MFEVFAAAFTTVFAGSTNTNSIAYALAVKCILQAIGDRFRLTLVCSD